MSDWRITGITLEQYGYTCKLTRWKDCDGVEHTSLTVLVGDQGDRIGEIHTTHTPLDFSAEGAVKAIELARAFFETD